ncbi:PadR family transcriptional regulator [Devriesea agamarum]|uniref:PadR family transcriptional regulator n=1 Tax=Devriesea agamarum TaxID=472569 RepID=UPI00071E53DB|nr:PadR family transcriptional regulator [Devriesea agamarum]
MTDVSVEWPAAWVRAVLGTAVLAALECEELHGYAIAERLAELGLGRPKGGSLYPLLAALEQSGAVETSWMQSERGPGRRTYRLTVNGRARLSKERIDWKRLIAVLSTASEPHREGIAP